MAILISKECPYKFTFNSCDTEGRILKINTHIDNDEYSFINVYAPNNVEERIQFYNNIKCYIDLNYFFLGGDCNEIFDPTTDHGVNTITFNIRSSNTLQSIVFYFNLIDIWRHRNPGKRTFNRSIIVENTLKQSRNDYCLISRNVIPFVINSYITHTLISDHEFVGLKLDFLKIERGGCIWILNQLLKDKIFNNAINDIINNACECPLLETEPLIW